MTIQALKAHLAIKVHDMAASIDFYRRLFDTEPVKVRTDYAKFDLENPLLNFTLNQHPFQEAGALSHLGFQVATTEDVLAIRTQWLARGPGHARRDANRLLLRYPGQDLGQRSGRQRVGGFRRPSRPSSRGCTGNRSVLLHTRL